MKQKKSYIEDSIDLKCAKVGMEQQSFYFVRSILKNHTQL